MRGREGYTALYLHSCMVEDSSCSVFHADSEAMMKHAIVVGID